MKRTFAHRLAIATLLLATTVAVAATAHAASTPAPRPNSAVLNLRVFNDCPSSNLTATNNYPSSVVIDDENIDCFGFANMHVWTLSEDGSTEAVFDNPAHFRFSMDFKIEGTGNGEGGLRISPWYSHYTDGLFNVRSTDGEIACFGGALPFYSFSAAQGVRYTKGNTIHLEVIYEPHYQNASNPGTIEYRLVYLGQSYTSGILPFGEQNPSEDPPHGLYGILNDARVGGHFKAFLDPHGNTVGAKATFSDIDFSSTPVVDGVSLNTRVFNDCPSSNLTTVNTYPDLVSFDDENIDCFGFANMHVWTFNENGAEAIFNNNASYRIATDFQIDGTGNGEGGLRISPWYSHNTDGLFNVRSTDGEIACFGGALPFYSFSAAQGVRYTKGTPIHLEAIYTPNARNATDPATIQYNLVYNGTSYTSGVLPFGEQNPSEDPPHTLYGMLDDGRSGGHFKAFLDPHGNTVGAKATFSNIVFSSCLNPVAFKKVALHPGDLNTNSHDKYVELEIQIQDHTTPTANDIDVSSIRVNGLPVLTSPAPKTDPDGHSLKVKVSRPALLATLTPGDHQLVQVEGEIGDNQCFSASLYIKVKAPKMHAPHHADQLAAGSVQQVSWDVDPTAASVSLLSSTDGGVTWTVDQSDVPNTGTANWLVPSTVSDNAMLAVTNVYETDETGPVNDSEYEVSESFVITAPLAVGPAVAPQFSLHVTNPSTGRTLTQYSLPNSGKATLDVFDVAGRTIESHQVGGHVGPQSMTLGRLPAGLYIVRLSQAGRAISNRVAVIQ